MISFSLGIVAYSILAALFVLCLLAVAVFVGPKRRSSVKDAPFECGTVGTGDASSRFSAKFYLVAVIFILFDVEVVFLYPWAVTLKSLGWLSFLGMMPFLIILELGILYIWRRGVLEF